VELGKQLSSPIYQVLSGQQQHQFDASTSRLIQLFQK